MVPPTSEKPARVQVRSLRKKHGVTPTTNEIRVIKSIVGRPGTSVKYHFEPALLFYFPQSTAVFTKGTLLIGWVMTEHGLRREVWCKPFETKVAYYYEPGGPPGSRQHEHSRVVRCDEWHPAIRDTIGLHNLINQSQNWRLVQNAYFAAFIKLMRAGRAAPSIENSERVPDGTSSKQDNIIDLAESDDQEDVRNSSSTMETDIDNPGKDDSDSIEVAIPNFKRDRTPLKVQTAAGTHVRTIWDVPDDDPTPTSASSIVPAKIPVHKSTTQTSDHGSCSRSQPTLIQTAISAEQERLDAKYTEKAEQKTIEELEFLMANRKLEPSIKVVLGRVLLRKIKKAEEVADSLF